MGNWQPTLPVSGTRMIDFPAIAAGNWDHLEDVFGVEHYSMNSALSGQHKPGDVSAVYIGPTASIDALASPTTGALAFDTNLGHFKWYNGGKWCVPAEHWNYSHISVHNDANQTLAHQTVCTAALDSELIDKLEEWNSSSFYMAISGTGFYLINATFLVQTTYQAGVSATVYSVDSDGEVEAEILHSEITKSADAYPINVYAVAYLNQGSKLHFSLYVDDNYDAVLVGDTNGRRSYANIFRLS